MLWLIIVGYVAITVLAFFWLATFHWKHGQSVGVIPFTIWLWPIFLPFILVFAALGRIARLGGQIERNERRERLARKVNEIDRGGKLPWE